MPIYNRPYLQTYHSPPIPQRCPPPTAPASPPPATSISLSPCPPFSPSLPQPQSTKRHARFILLGILVSYLPQHHRIISRRSSAGISPYFVLLGTTSGTCAFANILALPSSRADIACCKEVNGFECFAGLLGIAQVGVQWACFTVMYVPLPPLHYRHIADV